MFYLVKKYIILLQNLTLLLRVNTKKKTVQKKIFNSGIEYG